MNSQTQKESLDEIQRKLNVLDCLMSNTHNYSEEYENIDDKDKIEKI